MFEVYEDIMTAEEVGEALRINRKMAYRLLRTGELRGYREGRCWRVSKDELLAYIKRKVQGR